MKDGYPKTQQIITALLDLRNAVEMGQFKFRPGSRGQEEAARALAQANEVLNQVRKVVPNDGKIGAGR